MAIKEYTKGVETQLSANFVSTEFDCHGYGCCTKTQIDSKLVDYLQKIRDHFGAPLNINSGYRCENHNNSLLSQGAAPKSQHIYGRAADIRIDGVLPQDIAKYAESLGILGIGLYTGYVHVDTRTNKYFWKNNGNNSVSTFGGTYTPPSGETPPSGDQQTTTSQVSTNNALTIWQFFKAQGLTDAGAAAMLGNLFAESSLNPQNVEDEQEPKINYNDKSYTEAVDSGKYKNFEKDGVGYGLAQWTFSTRKEGLLKYIKSKGVSIGDLKAQLEYLVTEGEYKKVEDLLKTTNSIKEASDRVLIDFENPEDKSETAKEKRRGFCQTYYNQYKGTEIEEVTNVPEVEVTKIDKVVEEPKETAITEAKNRKIEYIVIHYTAGTTSKKGKAKDQAIDFNNRTGKERASADFIVDDEEIVQYNDDILNKFTWHCEGAKEESVAGGKFYNICTNENSIGIEICSTNKDGNYKVPNDPGFYFTDAVLKLTINLVKNLMLTYNIDTDHVIRHYDVTGQKCPGVIGWNEDSGDVSKWSEFKKSIVIKKTETTSMIKEKEISFSSYCARVTTIGEEELHCYQDKAENSALVKSYKRNDVLVIVKEEKEWGYTGKGWVKIQYLEKISASEATIQYILGDAVTLQYDPITKKLVYPLEAGGNNTNLTFLSHDENLDLILEVRQIMVRHHSTEPVLSNEEFVKQIIIVLEDQTWENKEQCKEKIQLVLKSATSSKNSLLSNASGVVVQTVANPLTEVSEKEILEKLDDSKKNIIKYFQETYEETGWNKKIKNTPETLNFWFDFMNTDGDMGKYAVNVIGSRSKAINDDKITAIYFQETPQVLFLTPEEYTSLIENKENFNDMTGYTFIKLQPFMENYFTISSQGKSAKDELDSLLYQHTCMTEAVTLTALPIYHLQPNTRIFVQDDYTGINGEYIINKITIPLQYNGTSSITTTKAVERIY